MNINLYIAKDNEVKLRDEPSMSGLVNQLLREHYEKQPSQLDPADQAIKAGLNKGMDNIVKMSTEKDCCTSTNRRCQHWDWDGDKAEWVNNLSGRRVAEGVAP